MTVERVTEATDELVEAFARLLPQLSPGRDTGPTLGELAADRVGAGDERCSSPATATAVVGTLTLVLYRIPTGARGWIHDVVVDESARGQGVGEALVDEALRTRARRPASRPST